MSEEAIKLFIIEKILEPIGEMMRPGVSKEAAAQLGLLFIGIGLFATFFMFLPYLLKDR